mgnify:CR=1 FL=1
MINKFVISRQEKVTGLLKKVSSLYESYNNREYDFEENLLKLLDDVKTYYENENRYAAITMTQSLKSDMLSTLKGIDPVKFEKITTGRRNLQLTTGFRVLKETDNHLRIELDNINAKLEEAEQIIGQVILTALQAGIISFEELKADITHTEIETMWKKISNDINLLLVQKKILLLVSYFDIIIKTEAVIIKLINSITINERN